jgi:serine/threonine-protein kinase
MIGSEFSREFFEQRLMGPSKIYELHVLGLPSYDFGVLFKREMIGLRPVLNVDFRTFTSEGISLYEVEFSGATSNFAQLVNSAVIKPLNAKLGERAFSLLSLEQGVVKVSFESHKDADALLAEFNKKPPAALASASPERLRNVIKDEATLERVAEVNPEAVAELRKGDAEVSKGFSNVEAF